MQAALQAAASRVANESITVICAGRTDTGVHGTNQVVHFDTLAQRNGRNWVLGINANTPRDISVRWASSVAGQFHARFSALSRTYRYVIYNGWLRPALMADQLAWEARPLNADRMQAAATYFEGQHDFSAFRAAGCQAHSPVRNIHYFKVKRQGELVILEVRANAFLQHMVRNMAGSLLVVGRGEKEPQWIGELLAGRDRTLAAETAPAGGLYFVDVQYPSNFELPSNAAGPHFLPDPLATP